MLSIMLYIWTNFQQDNWKSLPWQLRELDPAPPHPWKFSAEMMLTVSPRSSPPLAPQHMQEWLQKASFWGSNSGICTKDWLIWVHVLMFRFKWNNSTRRRPPTPGPSRVCFSCGPILDSLSSLLGKPFSSFQRRSSEEVNRNYGLQRHLALKSPKPFNFSLGRKPGSTGKDVLWIDCRAQSHGAKTWCYGLDVYRILYKCLSNQVVSALVSWKTTSPSLSESCYLITHTWH